MYESGLKGLEFISQAVGNLPEMVQGGGGNTSVKLDGELMAVKASGLRLNQVTSGGGFAVVKYKRIAEYYENVDLDSNIDYESDSVEFVKANTVELQGLKKLRPSVEAGFHSILKKYVIHSHSVYANILCCSQNGRELADRIFEGNSPGFIWVPYIKPGFSLTLKIKEEIGRRVRRGEGFPAAVFMENHGLIVNSDDCGECATLHAEVNGRIRQYLGMVEPYPQVRLEKAGEGKYLSKTGYILDFFQTNAAESDFFEKTVLYPDQIVYLNGNVTIGGSEGKLVVNTRKGSAIYNTGYEEALAIEETLLAYLYVVSEMKRHGIPLKTMSEKDADFIRNWESEKYRKSLLKDGM